MHCLKCGFEESKVVDSRSIEEGNSIRRRRECLNCKNRFTTYEKVEISPIIIIKKNGVRQEYNRNKILNGIIRACEKRPVSLEQIETIVSSVEKQLANNLTKEISSTKIGELIIGYLKDIDEISYVRFASVYRQFKDIDEFKEELNKLLK